MSVRTIDEAEVVVIGAGAVGTSVAFHLAKRGRSVVVVDRNGIAGGTSSATFAMIWVHSKEPLFYMELSLLSAQLYPGVVAELDEEVYLEQRGGLVLCMTEEELAKAHALIERQSRSPRFQGRVLDAREVHEIQPGLSEEVLGASYSPHDGHIDSIRYVTALARRARQLGARFLTQTEVVGIERRDGAVTGVLTSRGRIAARAVVNAAGPYGEAISRMVGLHMPVRLSRGQIVVTLPLPRTLRLPMSGIRQAPTGHFFFGFTNEDVGYDRRVTLEGVRGILANAVRKVPLVRDATVLRVFAGIRPIPPDGLPYLGAVPQVPGFYVAVSHSGITLSPLHGKVISDLICDGRTDVPIEPYSPTRFHQGGGQDEQ